MSDDRTDDRQVDAGQGRRRRQPDTPYDPERLKYFTQGEGRAATRRRIPEEIPPRDPSVRRPPPPPPPADQAAYEPPARRDVPPLQQPPMQPPPMQPPPSRPRPAPPVGAAHPRAFDPDPRHDAPRAYADPGREDYDRRHEGPRDRSPKRTAAAAARRKKRKIVALSAAVVVMLALVGGIGYAGLRVVGSFGSEESKDYTNVAGTGDVLVSIPQDSTLTTFGEILAENNVVASVSAFTSAAGDQPISAGFYKMRTEIPASTAVSMLTDTDNRVGRVVIPEGLQLDTKEGIDGKTTPGVFARVAEATTVDLNGVTEGATVEELAQAAATATPVELGVPAWAVDAVSALGGDHRRIEGLIAPTSWEMIDPGQSPVQILNYLISRSAGLFEEWGLPAAGTSSTDLTPYQTLVSASIVEREVNTADDYPKVARVIVNRLGDDQALQMDSTVNYTSAIQNIDVAGDDFSEPTKWHTYQNKGLPPTPIGAVGQPALQAAIEPPAGNWLYFVTIDQQGTTLFTEDYEQHKRNRQQACDNSILQTNC